MKLLIAAVIFVATLGMLFLIETDKSPKEDYARIIDALKEENSNAIVSVTPTRIMNPTPTPNRAPSRTPVPTLIYTPTPTPTPTIIPTPSPKQSRLININTAGLEELDNITGVGPVIAQRIIDYRNAYGPFQKIEDIKNVKGIGDVTFEKMRNEITVSDIP